MANSVPTKFWNHLRNRDLLFRDAEDIRKGENQFYPFFIDCPGHVWHCCYGKPSSVDNICGALVCSNFKIKKVCFYFTTYV